MGDRLRAAWRSTPALSTVGRSVRLRDTGTLVGLAVNLVALWLLPVPRADALAAAALTVVSAGVATLVRARHGGAAARPQLEAVAIAVSGMAVAIAAPSLAWYGALGVVLGVVHATAVRGPWAGGPLLALTGTPILVAVTVQGSPGAWWPGLALLLPMVAIALVATVGLAHDDEQRLVSELATVDRALARYGVGVVAGHPTATAVADAVAIVVGASVTGVTIELDARDPELRTPATLLRTAADGSTETVVELPMVVGDLVLGQVVVRLDRLPTTTELAQLDTLCARMASTLVAHAHADQERARRVRLEEAERLRDELVARITHDLRAPVATISAAVATLRDPGTDLGDEGRVQLHALLGRNVDRLEVWVESLLDEALAGIDNGITPTAVAVRDLFDAAAETAADQLVGHRLCVEPARQIVRADPRHVLRVLVNLLGNAAEYTPAGTPIIVRACTADDAVRIEVIDSGDGVPAAVAAQAFRPHHRGAVDGGAVDGRGLGLGLATVAELVRAHGGEVGIDDTPGGGATVWFTLPRVGVPTALAS